MKLAVITEFGEWSASTRYRALQHVEGLGRHFSRVDVLLPDDRPARRPGRLGQVLFFASHARRYLRRWRTLRRELGAYDAVLVQRAVYPMGPGAVTRPVERFSGRVVLDLDDAVFDVKPSLADRRSVTRWLYGPQQSRRLVARADALVVSTEHLAASLAASSPATVLPTVPDPTPYAVSDQLTVAPRVVWAGTVGGLGYLDVLAPVFAELEASGTGRLTVVSSSPWQGPSEFRPWTQEEEFTLLSEYAVGIMPLPDAPYTRGKAGFKLLQYMAAGVPVVASPVGVNRALVEDSGAGFLPETEREWVQALRRLLEDAALRSEMGTRGRLFVERYASATAQADVLAALLLGSESSDDVS